MKVAEVMSRDIEPVSADATIQEAATRMAELDVGALLVGTADVVEGILTDRDILLRAVVDGRDCTTLTVREIMSSTVFSCREEDEVSAAFREMSEHQVRRLPVLDEAGKPVGIVTLSDLTRHERNSAQVSEALREIAEPHRLRGIEEATADAAR